MEMDDRCSVGCSHLRRHGLQEGQEGCLPASKAVAGWEKTGETRTYAAKDLWQYIDGDAEQYISAGVVSTSTSDYKYQGHWKP